MIGGSAMRKVVKASVVLTMNKDAEIYKPGYVVVDGNRIVEVGKGEPKLGPDDELVDFTGKLLMPGLINAHAHTPMVLTRGMCEGVSLFTMDGFLNTLRRFEKYADSDMAAMTSPCNLAEMIRMGTTCFADQYFYADRIFKATDEAGLRGLICYGIVELGDEEARKRETARCEAFLEMCQRHPFIRGWVGPHAFFVDNSLDLIEIEKNLAKKYNTGFHIHFATSNEENDYCMAHYNKSAVTMMKELGILEVPILAAHAITVSEEDMETMKGFPFTPVMAPTSSMKSGFPAAPVKAYRDHGINVALGTDNLCSSSADMFGEMATGAKLVIHREHDVKAITAFDMVKMATIDGAKAIMMEDQLGSLENGKLADMIALDLSDPGWVPFCGQDYYTQLVYWVSGMSVTDSMVNGRFLMRDRKLLTIDYGKVASDVEKATAELKRRMGE